jgi:hypothetical protein
MQQNHMSLSLINQSTPTSGMTSEFEMTMMMPQASAAAAARCLLQRFAPHRRPHI